MPQYITKIRTEDGDKQIDYNALANLPDLSSLSKHTHTPESIGAAPVEHTHTQNDIADFPSSLPANGGNADTVDNMHASDFATASSLEQLQTQVDGMSLESFDITASATEINYLTGATKNIKELLNETSKSDHTHDDRYYTEDEVIALLAQKENTFASGYTILSSKQHGDEFPDVTDPSYVHTKGVMFLKRVVK